MKEKENNKMESIEIEQMVEDERKKMVLEAGSEGPRLYPVALGSYIAYIVQSLHKNNIFEGSENQMPAQIHNFLIKAKDNLTEITDVYNVPKEILNDINFLLTQQAHKDNLPNSNKADNEQKFSHYSQYIGG